MAHKSQEDRLSVFLSLILRHKPEAAGISLDQNGWANVQELLQGVNDTGRSISLPMLKRIVATDEKERYSFNEDNTKIRANQGHSLPVDVELKPAVPPDILYHGTATRFLSDIRVDGLTRQSRQYVHLSADAETAAKVGQRHGESTVLRIRAGEMYNRAGFRFWLSVNNVWLCRSVPVQYIEFDCTEH